MLPAIYLARHCETAWSLSGKHTGRTDLPLTPRGELDAQELGQRLRGVRFTLVRRSPLQRAARTCELAGFADDAIVDHDLYEWDYGAYEGRRTAEILAERPGWNLFRDGCPDGESPERVGARADHVIERLRAGNGNVLLFSSAHFLRVLAARWLGLPVTGGGYFVLGTAGLSILAYEHEDRAEPVIKLWNDTSHVGP